MTETEFQTIIQKLDHLDKDYQLLSEKLELYRTVSQQQIESFQQANRQQIEAFQDANKQQLNVSLGVLVTAAIAILASVVLRIAN